MILNIVLVFIIFIIIFIWICISLHTYNLHKLQQYNTCNNKLQHITSAFLQQHFSPFIISDFDLQIRGLPSVNIESGIGVCSYFSISCIISMSMGTYFLHCLSKVTCSCSYDSVQFCYEIQLVMMF